MFFTSGRSGALDAAEVSLTTASPSRALMARARVSPSRAAPPSKLHAVELIAYEPPGVAVTPRGWCDVSRSLEGLSRGGLHALGPRRPARSSSSSRGEVCCA